MPDLPAPRSERHDLGWRLRPVASILPTPIGRGSRVRLRPLFLEDTRLNGRSEGAAAILGRSARAVVWVAVAAGGLGCGDSENTEVVPTSTPSVSLFSSLKEAKTGGPGLADLTDPDAGIILSTNLGEDATGWSLGNGAAMQEPHVRTVEDDAQTWLFLSPSAQGMHTTFAAPESGMFEVQVRIQPLQAAGASLTGIQLSPQAKPSNSLELPLGKPKQLLPAGSEGTWQELHLFIGRQAGRESLQLSVFAGPGGALIDRVRVRRLPLAAGLSKNQQPPNDHSMRAFVRCADQYWDSLLLPAPSWLEWRCQVPDQARFTTAVSLLTEHGGDSIQFSITANGEELWRQTRTTEPDRLEAEFELVSLPLDRYAGQAVTFRLATSGSDHAVGLWGAPRLLTPQSSTRPNLILLSLDTLRADALGCYGKTPSRSPHIDQLARTGVVFERMYSTSSYTLPTHASLFTGQSPFAHGVHRPPTQVQSERSPLLGRQLRDQGYISAAFTGGGFVDPTFGFGSGFDCYGVGDPGGRKQQFLGDFLPPLQQRDDLAMQSLLKWLEIHRDQPFFLFVHTYLVHNYVPSTDYQTATEAEFQDAASAWQAAKEQRDPTAVRYLQQLYEDSVEQVDAEVIGRLLQALQRWNLESQTIICLISDHGEEFLEHDALGHGTGLWNELVRVPWILSVPGEAPGRNQRLVNLADVAPTLAPYLGLAPEPRWTGRPQLRDAAPEPTATTMVLDLQDEHGRWEAVVAGDWKLILQQQHDQLRTRLFHLSEDPSESRDLADDQQKRRRQLTGLAQSLASQDEEFGEQWGELRQGSAMSSQVEQALLELGYLGDS